VQVDLRESWFIGEVEIPTHLYRLVLLDWEEESIGVVDHNSDE
jgi:hypothetical protein